MHRDNIQPCMVRALSRNVIREDSRFDTSLMSYSRSTTYCFLFNFYHFPCLELSQLLHTLSCSPRMKIEEVFDVLKSQSSKSSNTISIFSSRTCSSLSSKVFGSYIDLTTHEDSTGKYCYPPPPPVQTGTNNSTNSTNSGTEGVKRKYLPH